MFKQLASKKTLSRSLPMAILVCVTIFFLVGCTSNYTLQGTTTNGNGHQGQGSTSNSGSGSTQTTGSQGGSTGGSQGGSTGSGTFQVTSVDLAVSPSSIAGTSCGTQVTFTYTATFHIAANSPGGTISFSYTTNNRGGGGADMTQTEQPGQTTATFQFSKSGQVGSAYAFPDVASVIVTSPNSPPVAQAIPDGQCS